MGAGSWGGEGGRAAVGKGGNLEEQQTCFSSWGQTLLTSNCYYGYGNYTCSEMTP